MDEVMQKIHERESTPDGPRAWTEEEIAGGLHEHVKR
jgi:hypothetical protein